MPILIFKFIPYVTLIILISVLLYSFGMLFSSFKFENQTYVVRRIISFSWIILFVYLLFFGLWLGIGNILILNGVTQMTSGELILNIALMMHVVAIAFAVAAIIVVLFTIYSAVTKKGQVSELNKLLRSCIIVSVFFWLIAWFIV